MTIKEAREKAGWSQAVMAQIMGIPKRTIENWESGVSAPPQYVSDLIVADIARRTQPPAPKFRIHNSTVKNYAEVCKKFSHDSADWLRLPDNFITTDSGDWKETSDNAHGGVDVSWAFGLDDAEIAYRAAEELYENLRSDIQIAVDDGWNPDQLEAILEKYDI